MRNSPAELERWTVSGRAPPTLEERAAALFEAIPEPPLLSARTTAHHRAALAAATRRWRSGPRLLRAAALAAALATPLAFAAAKLDLAAAMQAVVAKLPGVFQSPRTRPAPAHGQEPASSAVPVPSVRSEPKLLEGSPRPAEPAPAPRASRNETPDPSRSEAEQTPPSPAADVESAPGAPAVLAPGFKGLQELAEAGNGAEAVARLERLEALPGHEVPGELHLVWGELLAAGGRCSEAIPHFDTAMHSGSASSIEERALHGRLVCHAVLGDAISSHADADLYLRRFPNGRHAELLRRRHAH